MELIATTIRAYDSGCIGCQRHDRDIMLSFMYEGDPERSKIHDLFLTQEQALALHKELGERIEITPGSF